MAPKNGTHYTPTDPPPKVRWHPVGKSLTRQSEAADTNINTIMRRYETTGVLPTAGREGFYADVSEMGDYRTALEQVRRADEAFMQLPAHVRARFDNDAALFLDFTSDPANKDEMREMGLIEKNPADEPRVVATPAVPAVPAVSGDGVS